MIDRRKFIKSISALGISIPLVKSNLKPEKKSTATNSANVSIATSDKPATIAGRAAGNIIE